jgi:hypothetical protein
MVLEGPRFTIAMASSTEELIVVKSFRAFIEEFTYFKLPSAIVAEPRAFVTSFTIERA